MRLVYFASSFAPSDQLQEFEFRNDANPPPVAVDPLRLAQAATDRAIGGQRPAIHPNYKNRNPPGKMSYRFTAPLADQLLGFRSRQTRQPAGKRHPRRTESL